MRREVPAAAAEADGASPPAHVAAEADDVAVRALLQSIALQAGGDPAEELRRHGLSLRAMLLDTPGSAARLAGRLALDGADGDLLAVRRLVLGWSLDEPGGRERDMAFDRALDALVRGLAPRPTGQPRPLHVRLWALLNATREGADLLYSRVVHLPELDRRLLLILSRTGPHVTRELTALSGVDKAQVSRAIKRLGESGLVERTTVRQPIALTPAGRALTARLLRLFSARSRDLVYGISAEDLDGFFTGLDEVWARAVHLYEQERAAGGGADRQRENILPPDLMTEAAARGPEIIVSRLIALMSYIQRSATLSYKRLLGLSNFEAWVLAAIARAAPIEWAQLAAQVARDESQAARTVRRLVELGLIEHRGVPGRRQGALQPTPAGAKAAKVVDDEQARRDRALVDGLPADIARAFSDAIERMTWNVQSQLVRDLATKAGDGRG